MKSSIVAWSLFCKRSSSLSPGGYMYFTNQTWFCLTEDLWKNTTSTLYRKSYGFEWNLELIWDFKEQFELFEITRVQIYSNCSRKSIFTINNILEKIIATNELFRCKRASISELKTLSARARWCVMKSIACALQLKFHSKRHQNHFLVTRVRIVLMLSYVNNSRTKKTSIFSRAVFENSNLH